MDVKQKRRRVLAIDNNARHLLAISAMLKGNYEVAVSGNFRETVSHLSKGNVPDVILLYVDFEQSDVFGVYRQIRQMPGLEQTPVAFMTEKRDADLEKQSHEIGVAGVLAKPLEQETLVAFIGKLV